MPRNNQKSKLDLEFQRLDEVAFNKCPSISIDIAVMEKTKKELFCHLRLIGVILEVGNQFGKHPRGIKRIIISKEK